jgi:PBP1b-binding outer membrane lipoprotein LpoB
MKYYLLIICLLFVGGCATKQTTPPPSVSTAQVIQSLTDAKTDLKEAGDQNTAVAQKIDRALTLAERLDTLLAQIEQEAQATANKNVINPN